MTTDSPTLAGPAPGTGVDDDAPATAAATSTAAPSTAARSEPDHVRLGIGARVTLHPAADDVVPVILGALRAATTAVPDVQVRTDDVSTLVRGPEVGIASFVTVLLEQAALATPSGHVVLTLALSRGCPGAVTCDVPGTGSPTVEPVGLAPVGRPAAAHWTLYPLGVADAMAPIADAIATAQERGTLGGPESYATRLEGDLADVVGTVVDTWSAAGAEVAHVAAHATISVGSPSARGAR